MILESACDFRLSINSYGFFCNSPLGRNCGYNPNSETQYFCEYWIEKAEKGYCTCAAAKYEAFHSAVSSLNEIYIQIQEQDPAFHEALKTKRERQYVEFICSIKGEGDTEWKPKI